MYQYMTVLLTRPKQYSTLKHSSHTTKAEVHVHVSLLGVLQL